MSDTRSCLVVSYGPVPTPQYQTIEGGGMRAWGLAKGFEENDFKVTVAVNQSFPQDLSEHEGIGLVNWAADENFVQLLNAHDVVVVSYCMGSDSVFVADNISSEVTLVLDAYVPIYIEVSARDSDNTKDELQGYLADIERFNHVLKRGDYFLCANSVQKIYYTGILGSLGVINPRSYRQDRVLEVPFGIHDIALKAKDNPYSELGITKDDKVILWFGGIYPWFHIEDYLEAILKLSQKDPTMRFVFVGGKNPFNPNPDFSKQYDKSVAFAKKNGLLGSSMFFVDWVDYGTRGAWYKHADFVISLNQPGEENQFSWRTRVMDYVWGELVTLTNGGDPLGETLIGNSAAVKLESLSPDGITKSITDIYRNAEILTTAHKNLLALKPTYFWGKLIQPLAQRIQENPLPYSEELSYRSKHSIAASFSQNDDLTPDIVKKRSLLDVYRIPQKVYRHAREKGLKRSLRLAGSIAKNKLAQTAKPGTKQYIIVSNPLDSSGAPVVATDIATELSTAYGGKNIRIISPFASKEKAALLASKHIGLEKAALGLSLRLTGIQLGIQKNDFVLLNTVAVYNNYRDYILNLLDSGRLKHAYWFIHEDIPQVHVVAPELLKEEYTHKIKRLVDSGKLQLLVPSKRIQQVYEKEFDVKTIKTIPLHVNTGNISLKPKTEKDFQAINFFMSGSSSDGRKGQLIAIAAFQRFIDKYQARDPKTYRDFNLHLITIGDDYVSTQLKTIGKAVFGKKLHLYPSLPKEEALQVTSRCNAVLCCSLNETFAIYVAEGMLMGHIVLRNDSAGIDEQLRDGDNGYFIDSDNINQMADVLEKILNKKFASKSLVKMSRESQRIANKFQEHKYIDHF